MDDNNEMLVDINFERSDSDSERSDQNRLQIDPWKCVSDEVCLVYIMQFLILFFFCFKFS